MESKYLLIVLIVIAVLLAGVGMAVYGKPASAKTWIFRFMNEEVLVDNLETNSIVSITKFCDELGKLGMVLPLVRPDGACGQIRQVLGDYNIGSEILNGVRLEFKSAPFDCDTFNIGIVPRNGCYYYAKKLLQINPRPSYTLADGTQGVYNFDWLLLHEIARATGIKADDEADNYAFAKIKERRARLGLQKITNHQIIFSQHD